MTVNGFEPEALAALIISATVGFGLVLGVFFCCCWCWRMKERDGGGGAEGAEEGVLFCLCCYLSCFHCDGCADCWEEILACECIECADCT